MQCIKCGQRLADTARRCPNCGAVIDPSDALRQQAEAEKMAAEEARRMAAEETQKNAREQASYEEYREAESGPGPVRYENGRYVYNTDYSEEEPRRRASSVQYNNRNMAPMALGMGIACLILSLTNPFLALGIGVFAIILSARSMKTCRRSLGIWALVISCIAMAWTVMLAISTIYLLRNPDMYNMIMQYYESLMAGAAQQ